MIPMIKNVRDAFPEAWITVAVNSPAPREVIEHSGVRIEKVFICDMHSGLKNTLCIIEKLRKEKFDIGIANANTTTVRAMCFFSMIRVTNKIGIQFSKRTDLGKLEDKFHFVDAHLLAVEGIISPINRCNPSLFVTDLEKSVMKSRIGLNNVDKPVVGICVGRADITYKNHLTRSNPVYTRGWGELEQHIKNMTELIKKCVNHIYVVILIGGKAEVEIKDRIVKNLSSCPNVIDMVGKTSMGESIALASLCNVVVGVDTGMQHVSDAIGVATISLFGPTNPKTHGAYSDKARFIEADAPCKFCFGTVKYMNCADRKCMKRINVNDVFNAVNQVFFELNTNRSGEERRLL